jgi:xeroderma pigmentosum group C-complementing protein
MSGQMITDKPLEIFGPWQVDDYVPPPAVDGKVPRNEYGNVELFKPTMLPKGTVHLASK